MHLPNFTHYVIELSHRHGALVVVQTLIAIANTLANSFALIYLHRNGADYVQCGIFVLISVLVPVLLVAFASRTIVRRFTLSIDTALISLAAYYVCLMVFHGWHLVLIPPLFFGTYIATFWVPYNALIMHITSRKKRGAAVGVYFLIFPMVSTLAPLLGGAVIALFSFQVLFAISAVIAVGDLVYVSGYKVLVQLRERVIIPELLQTLKVNMLGRQHMDLDLKVVDWRLRVALFAQGIQDGVFWICVPLISFEFARSEEEVGAYFSLFAFWGAVMTVGLGYLSDRLRDRTSLVRLGATFGGLSIILASSAGTPAEFATYMSLAYLWIAMVPSFLFTMLVDRLERYKKKGVLVREFLLNLGRALGVAITIALLLLNMELSVALMVSGTAFAVIVLVK